MLIGALSFIVCLIGTPHVMAGDLTDALTDADPRIKLESGLGVAFDSIYAPRDESEDSSLEEESLHAPRPVYLGDTDSYRALQSPLDEPASYGRSDHLTPSGRSDSEDGERPSFEPMPLGKPDQREGVWYEDDLRP